MGIPGEGRKCRETAKESGRKKRENPSWCTFASEIPKEASDQEATKKITNKNTGRETLDHCILGKGLYPGGEAVSRE